MPEGGGRPGREDSSLGAESRRREDSSGGEDLPRGVASPGRDDPPEGAVDAGEGPGADVDPWHVDLGLRVGHTKLAWAKRELDRRLDTLMNLDVLGVFHSPQTPLDRRTDLGMNTFYVGVGRAETDWLVWTGYVGGGGGQDDEHQRFAALNLTTKFHYQTYYTGVAAEVYPWGRPVQDAEGGWAAHLRAGRPYLLTGFEVGFVGVHAKGRFAVAPFRLYEDHETIHDTLFSFLIGAGWGFPLNQRWSLNLAGWYAQHLYRPEEYNTWNFVTTVRYALGTNEPVE